MNEAADLTITGAALAAITWAATCLHYLCTPHPGRHRKPRRHPCNR